MCRPTFGSLKVVPPRKYYKLTSAGETQHEKQVREWLEFTTKVNELLRGDKDE